MGTCYGSVNYLDWERDIERIDEVVKKHNAELAKHIIEMTKKREHEIQCAAGTVENTDA